MKLPTMKCIRVNVWVKGVALRYCGPKGACRACTFTRVVRVVAPTVLPGPETMVQCTTHTQAHPHPHTRTHTSKADAPALDTFRQPAHACCCEEGVAKGVL